MRYTIYYIALCVMGIAATGSTQPLRVYLADKEVPKTILPDDVALSHKALERRTRQGIPLDSRDLPVSSAVIQTIHEMGGEVVAHSRWFNYLVVDGLEMEALEKLPFVKRLEVPKAYKTILAMSDACEQVQTLNYGLATEQIEMLRGHKLHELGYMGQGMTIAVLDGGFIGTDNGVAFDSLWLNNRILGTYNFIDKDTNIYNDGNHGTKVLSILGGYLNNQLVGSAPRANYWLLKSEQESNETPVEMDYWLMAAEYADSVGADIISSSLGYNEFNSGQDYTYSDMDGNTTVVTKAADMAAQKGLLVIVSAGNEGSSQWKHITAPADGDSVMAVGGVTDQRQRISFSSIGPTADGRIKPDVMAQGSSTAYATNDMAFTGNGTSFSCPLISGMAACLWQLNPSKSNMEIFRQIVESADRASFPDNNYGYGIPNFEHAFYQIGLQQSLSQLRVDIFPNPVENTIYISTNLGDREEEVSIRITDLTGNLLSEMKVSLENDGMAELDFPYSSGIYIMQLTIGETSIVKKILK
ncbi:MAG TPA: hypothetical protein DDW81_01190 [Cryomorphaceae bacterium]|nr:hypothetical protein [Owenweeksia sp.]HBF18676.1 hypothetical protein [Cryomorphaceae bacterium]